LRHATPEMVGQRGLLWDGLLFKVVQVWSRVPKEGIRFSLKKPQELRVPGLYHEFYELALMDLFGLVGVELPARPVVPWVPAGIGQVPSGDAVFTLLSARVVDPFYEIPLEEEEEEEEEPDEPIFGAWQPLFQPYFPEWRQNLELPEAEERE